MSEWDDYELLDFGAERKLERFGPWVLDRPSPGADGPVGSPQAWRSATARYEGDRATEGRWRPAPQRWAASNVTLEVPLPTGAAFRMLLSPLPSGQIGLFPEQFSNWIWVARKVASATEPLRVLNLFGYSGGSTLAAAAAGAEVTHVDASRSMVTRARENARASKLLDAPIRWIVEDAVKYCQREVKRGSRYHGIILDPPSYGHGPKGEQWSLTRDLLPLLELCRQLTDRNPSFILCTCHTPGVGPAELSAYISEGIVGHCGAPPRSGELSLHTGSGRRLASGVVARWPA